MAPVLHSRTGQNICSPLCPVEHVDFASRIAEPPKGWPDIRGLHSLNSTRDAWLVGDAIEVSITGYWRGLPESLQQRIGLGIPGLNPKFWHMGPSSDEAVFRAIAIPARRALNKIRETEYSIFPICTNGNHWVLVVLHKSQPPSSANRVNDGDNNAGLWSHVVQACVLDPYRQAARTAMVHQRLRRWLEEAGKFTFAANYQRTVWVPLQRDTNSCGPRAYWAAKQFMDRLLELYEEDKNYNEDIWDPLSGWFNEGFVRGEMTGRCAWEGVRAMGFNGRVAIECVNRVKAPGAAGYISASQAMSPADMKWEEPEKPSNQKPRHSSVMDWKSGVTMADKGTQADDWQAPTPTPNQHKMVPGVYHCGQGTGAPDANQGAKYLGPAYPVAPPYPGPVIPNHHALPTAPPIPGPLFPLGNLFGAASSSKHWNALHPPPNPLPPNFFGTASAPKVDGKETPEIQVIDQFKLIDLANITQMSFKPITPATPAKKPLSYINTPTATGSLGISPQHPIVLTDESSPGIITSAKTDLSIILPSQGSFKRGLSDDAIVTGGPRKKAKISK